MNRWDRHEQILQAAAQRGTVYLPRAMQVTGASAATVRRDFADLAAAGSVKRIRGGVRVISREGNLPFSMRQAQHSAAKDAIGRAAADLLRQGDVVFIDGGTTTFHLCLHLPAVPLRIITNSMRIASHLSSPTSNQSQHELYLTGGLVQPEFGLLAGPGTLHSLDFYHANWAFLSVGGITDEGLYNTSESVVQSERKMIEQSDRAVVLADHSKLGKRAMCRIAHPSAIDRLITNEDPSSAMHVRSLRAQNIAVTCTSAT